MPIVNRDIESYVKVYENFLDDELCNQTVEKLKNENWQHHQHQSWDGNFVSYDDELSVSWSNIHERGIIQNKIWSMIERYICKDYANFVNWWNVWNGYSPIRFNRYAENTRMKTHCDHIHSIFDGERKGIPTLTILGSLNDDYEGGELIMWEDTVINLPKGAIMLFPSNFMYPHRIDHVKKGVRYSYVSWVW